LSRSTSKHILPPKNPRTLENTRAAHAREASASSATPRGWKLGKILPIHSPAYSGGGISDNPFKEAMEEMQKLQGVPGMAEPSNDSGGDTKKKKDKKARA